MVTGTPAAVAGKERLRGSHHIPARSRDSPQGPAARADSAGRRNRICGGAPPLLQPAAEQQSLTKIEERQWAGNRRQADRAGKIQALRAVLSGGGVMVNKTVSRGSIDIEIEQAIALRKHKDKLVDNRIGRSADKRSQNIINQQTLSMSVTCRPADLRHRLTRPWPRGRLLHRPPDGMELATTQVVRQQNTTDRVAAVVIGQPKGGGRVGGGGEPAGEKPETHQGLDRPGDLGLATEKHAGTVSLDCILKMGRTAAVPTRQDSCAAVSPNRAGARALDSWQGGIVGSSGEGTVVDGHP